MSNRPPVINNGGGHTAAAAAPIEFGTEPAAASLPPALPPALPRGHPGRPDAEEIRRQSWRRRANVRTTILRLRRPVAETHP